MYIPFPRASCSLSSLFSQPDTYIANPVNKRYEKYMKNMYLLRLIWDLDYYHEDDY